ncbi:uncharacterized protein FIBRA_03060 [Fibroporia radiculosa]|uniref:Bromo domain-containing protein n=1 Tax=Fibroporia radiculosa TaxID=599839 RepID=J4HVS3_9APHY|nr:uncharacterized protein FIBRA_03060 [Fibroporia radiculosa]CCM01012.1 predicted protein [Fibroporia radiculosa]
MPPQLVSARHLAKNSKRSSKRHLVSLPPPPRDAHELRMNNLLRTLTENQVRSAQHPTDLKLLLSAVKDSRRQSHDVSKLSDAFYDSLEGLLLDLRTVTLDNRDSEAFLKPVSRTEVPDYYIVIATPMDLQTMLKKVKQKQYKSKKEFKDDLDLIWSNCFTYNATENHPLRLCAKRLKVKAEQLLKNITDWKERVDPAIPTNIPQFTALPGPNGVSANGHARYPPPTISKAPSPGKAIPKIPGSRKARGHLQFEDALAITRSPAGMSSFARLDHALDQRLNALNSADSGFFGLEEQLNEFIVASDDETDAVLEEVTLKTIDGDTGAKRKLNGFIDNRPRKRVRTHRLEDKDVVELWWDALQSDDLIGNGLPNLVCASSEPIPTLPPPIDINDPPRETTVRHRKKKKLGPSTTTLLYHMNNNIRTLRRVRTTHAKFAILSQNSEEGAAPVMPFDPVEELDDVIDEQPWKPMGSGIEIGEKSADNCLHWMGGKVLEHAGFQGTSKVALDVLTSVTSEYLLNVGRTIRFLTDKYARKMTPEEIILHTLFESGTTRIYELERYIKDDVVRYGSRLTELEKKLANAYREATAEEAWDDDALFQIADDEEEDGQFVMGNFAESFGEDFLGLRELGIAAEFGLSSLTIPKKLLKGKSKQGHTEDSSAAKPSEPPPPFPPPPPLVPLDSRMVESQIGLLKPYYQQRLASLSAPSAPPSIPIPPPPYLADTSFAHPAPIPALIDANAVPIPLPDDAPSPSHTKIGPLGQIMKPASSTANSKKKSKGKVPNAPIPGPNGTLEGTPHDVLSPLAGDDAQRKPKPPMASTSKKKSSKGPDALPPVLMASA